MSTVVNAGYGADGAIAVTTRDQPRQWYDLPAPAMVGRRAELAHLGQAWAAARSGQPQTVVLAGDPGSGKTRLVQEACRQYAPEAQVLRGACLMDAPVAYEPFVEPVTRLAAGATDAASPLGALGLDGTRMGQSGARLTDEVYEAVAELVASSARHRPIVFVVEDVHWATQTTMGLLAWLVRRLHDCPVLLLVTTRATPPDRSESVMATLAALAREPGFSRIEIGGLEGPDVVALLRTLDICNGYRPEQVAQQLHAQTGGNPFLLHEVAREIREHGCDPLNPMVPATVRDIIAARLAGFAGPDREFVEFLAVLGEQVPASLLETAAPLAVRLAALDQATEVGLVVPMPDGAYRFLHALGRQAVLDRIPGARRAALHHRAVELLRPRLGAGLAELAQLAHHCLAAGMHDDGMKYLLAAAESAARALAWKEAGDLFRRAGDLTQAADERQRYHLMAVHWYQMSSYNISGTKLAHQVALEATAPATRLAAASLRERTATLEGGDLDAVRMLVQILGEYPEAVDDHVREAVASLGRGLAQVGDNQDFQDSQRLRAALARNVRRTGDWERLADALEPGLGRAFGRPELAREVLSDARELSALLRRRSQKTRLGDSGFFQVLLGFRTGDPDAVRAGVADFLLGKDNGFVGFGYWPAIAKVGRLFQRGDFAGAQAAALRGEELARSGWEPLGLGHSGLQRFLIGRECDQLAQVTGLLTGREELHGRWAPGLLALYVAAGMRVPAAALLARLARDDVLALNDRTEYLPTTLAFMVEAALYLSDVATLRRLRPLLAGHSGLNLVSEQFVALHGSADRYLGMIDSRLGQGDPLASFEAAAELDRRSDAPVHLGLTLAARAAHLAAVRGPGDSAVRSAIAAARAVAEPIGHVRVLKAMDRLTGADHPAGPHSQPVDSGGLTARELEVLALIVAGASNAQIARSLYISQNTAANHVRSILAKLGADNRTQAAMLAVSRGLVAAP